MGYDSKENAQQSPVGDTAAAYKLAHEQRAFEIAQLTNRNNFFMVFQGVLLAGLVQSQGGAPPVMNFFVCLAGMAISLFQAGMAGGAKYWQIRWEVAVKELELLLLEDLKQHPRVVQLFTSDIDHLSEKEKLRIKGINDVRATDKLNEAPGFIDGRIAEDLKLRSSWSVPKHLIGMRFSVSKIPLYAGIVLFAIWTMLWLHTFSIWGVTLPAFFVAHLPWSAEVFRFIPLVK